MDESRTDTSNNNLLAELVKALKSSRTAPEQVDLPIFRPDLSDAKKWLTVIENIKNEFEWSDQQIILRFMRDFSEAFPSKKILGELFLRVTQFDSDRCNTYEAYVFEKVNLLRNLHVQWDEADFVEITVHGITESDVRTISYLGSVPKRQPEELKSERKASEVKEPPRKHFRDNRDYDLRRKRPLTCYNCGKDGNIQKFCIERKDTDKPKILAPTSYSKSSNTTANLGPYEIMGITSEGRYEIKRVGKSLVTKDAKEQLRIWPSDWSMTMDMEELLEDLENDSAMSDDNINNSINIVEEEFVSLSNMVHVEDDTDENLEEPEKNPNDEGSSTRLPCVFCNKSYFKKVKRRSEDAKKNNEISESAGKEPQPGCSYQNTDIASCSPNFHNDEDEDQLMETDNVDVDVESEAERAIDIMPTSAAKKQGPSGSKKKRQKKICRILVSNAYFSGMVRKILESPKSRQK
ncbi:unnamed protein product [Ceutorhynchus assimilis]|uniref:Uncharacterized protein n=1 Tax=Ceutorhynchus assimilis TaxID=467358 RepID=A0A9N9QJM5_9CUCU|nr:unnamed protein product [Ceutorhynchus assimilis]